MKKQSRPKDPIKLAKLIVDIATGEIEDTISVHKKNPAAVALGRLGGLKGGKARADKLTSVEKSAIAKKAAQARWGKNKKKK